MAFFLKENLGASDQTLSLQSSGAQQLANTYAFPFYLFLRSGSTAEVVRALAQESASDLTILRAQLGSTALSFTTADTADYYPVPVGLLIYPRLLGSPALGTATALNAAIPLTNAPQPGVIPTSQPDVARICSAKGNAGGIAGNVTFHGVASNGASASETIALSGASEVFTTIALAGDVTVDLPVETHAGTDTVSLGVGDKLGLLDLVTRNTIVNAYLNGVIETTKPVVATGNAIANCTVDLNSALNGDPVALDMYVD